MTIFIWGLFIYLFLKNGGYFWQRFSSGGILVAGSMVEPVFALESEGCLPGLALFFMGALISWPVSWMGTSLWETQRC